MEAAHWEDCIYDNDYEIFSDYPFTIRRKDNGFVVTPTNNGNGYLRIFLNGRPFYLHRVIAEQFIANPDNLPQVDHKNGRRDDYHLENLRFVSHKENANNLHSKNGIDYEFVDELENNTLVIDYVGDFIFENYYVNNSNIIYFDGNRYRILLKHPSGRQWSVRMRDVNGKIRSITKRRLEAAIEEIYGEHFDLD